MDKIQELLTRGVEEVYVKRELETALNLNKKLRIYYGVDPSGPVIHIGHAVLLRKLQIFQELGHKIIFLIGDFTGMIGDPTDRAAIRQPLTRKQVLANAKTYKRQVARFLNFAGKNPAEIRFNSEWNDILSFKDLIELAGRFTVQQLLERDMFKKRISDSKPIGLHEFLYPLIQGYDAVMLEADMQVGGTDQTFNMLQGRHLRKSLKDQIQIVMTCQLLEGTDGRKMSKSFDNIIAIDDESNEMFGKVMSVSDELIRKYFVLATRVEIAEIDEIMKLKNPRDQKYILAEKITELYHDKKHAQSAKEAFINQFTKNKMPVGDSFTLIEVSSSKVSTAAIGAGLASSKTEFRRLMTQGGVRLEGRVLGVDEEVKWDDKGKLLQIGKRKFARIKKK